MSGFSMELATKSDVMTEVVEQTKPLTEEEIKLREQAKNNVLAIVSMNLDSIEEKHGIVNAVENLGGKDINTANEKNKLMAVQIDKLSRSGAEGSTVANGLLALQEQVGKLDPKGIDFINRNGLLSKLFSPIKAYFSKYQSAQHVIDDTIENLKVGQKTLKDDNVTLEIEQSVMRQTTKNLNQALILAGYMDEEIEKAIAEESNKAEVNQEKIKFMQEEVQYPLRQNIMDIQQTILVNQNGIVAMEVIRRNNRELIKGVDRAIRVTVTALRTAVMVAGALYNQKIVLDSIKALNETTSNMIASTSEMLKEQGVAIQQQSSEATISPDKLKEAFANLTAAVEDISTFRQKALPEMKATIAEFKNMAEDGEKVIQKLEKGDMYTQENNI